MQAPSFVVPPATMHEALQAVVMKPLQERLLAIHWTLDDVKELLNNQAMETQELKKMLAEKEEKGPTKEMVDTIGAQLVAISQKLAGLIKEVDDVLAKKPK